MEFENFARAHGLIIQTAQLNKWVATPTEDHPQKRNGRYKYLGDVGWVQNWATMERPEMWRRSGVNASGPDYRHLLKQAERERMELAKKAADKAGWIMHQTKLETHPYMAKKGFPNELVPVWETEGKRLLVIPMRVAGNLVGAQLINEDGEKKFLKGQRTKGAAFCVDAKGLPIFVEGFATGLSVRIVMKTIKLRYSIYVCFSAGNLKEVADRFTNGIVIADNDVSGTGRKAAEETGKPYWLPPTTGQDFNDYWVQVGTFRAGQSIKSALSAELSSAVETWPRSAGPVRG